MKTALNLAHVYHAALVADDLDELILVDVLRIDAGGDGDQRHPSVGMF